MPNDLLKMLIKRKFLLPFLFLISTIHFTFGQRPATPEASSFEPVDATDMVNLMTGSFTYVLPLLNVPSPEGGYPISIFYHSGIAMDQDASWVGLGWNLNSGAINRNLIGVPDDHHNFKIQDVYYNLIDEYKDFTASISYASQSLGASLSYSTHKGFGGSVSYGLASVSYSESSGFGMSSGILSYSDKSGLGLKIVNGSYVFQDESGAASSSSSAISYDLEYNFKSGGLTFNFASNTSIGLVNSSTGFSLSSKGASSSSSVGIGPVNSFGGGYLNNAVSSTLDGWIAAIPIWNTGFILTLSSSKVKQWIFSNETNFSVGSSAFNHQFNEYTNPDFNDKFGNFHTTDVIVQPTNPFELGPDGAPVYSHLVDSDDHFIEINYPAFDNYSVNSQGLSGVFSLKYFENIQLPIGKRRNVNKVIDTNDLDEFLYKRRTSPWERSSSTNKPYFYFNNEFSSYLELTKANSSSVPTSIPNWDLSNLSTTNSITLNSLYTSLEHSIPEGNGLGNINGRKKRTGSYIKSFTKEDIINQGSSLNFLYATNNNIILDYGDIYSKTAETDYAIIGFRVTAIDGKTYHYSIPVYQKELISRTEKESNPTNKFNEHRNFSNYATHWLLTAITGPDFIDMNQNNIPDEGDFGYWVRFEYGKWSDGFGWETTPRESIAFEDCDDPINNPSACDEISYISKSRGVKEVYYLNKIKTRTHSALFLKSLRDDAKGISFSEGISRTDPKIYTNVRKEMSFEDYQAKISVGTFKSFYNVKPQNNFKLDKIVLIKNEDDNYYSNSVNKVSTIGGDFYFHESFERWNVLGQYLGTVSNTIHDTTWDAEFYNNILEVDDIIDYSDLMNKSLKVIQFNYMPSISNKLNLISVGSRGRSNVNLIPDYKFTYYNTGGSSSADRDLRWGYHSYNPQIFSLKSIENPLGVKMTVEYESHSYYSLRDNSSSPTIYTEGGIRTKSISLNNGTKIKYEYYDGISSKRPEDIPNATLSFLNYEDDVFGISPQVFYRRVIEKNLSSSNQILNFNEYIFDIPQDGFSDLRRFIDYGRSGNANPPNNPTYPSVIGNVIKRGKTYTVKSSNYNIKDNTAAFGRLLQKKSFNAEDQLLSHRINFYRNESDFEIKKQGLEQETFSSIKRVDAYYADYDPGFLTFGSSYNVTHYGLEYYLMSASKKRYPSVLEKTRTIQSGHIVDFIIDDFDFLTGQPLESSINDSKGQRFKSKIIPAYTVNNYSQDNFSMSAIADNSSNKNMLSQVAANYTFIEDNGSWKPVSVGIQTWSNQWNYRGISGIESTPPNHQKIWRKHKTFIWNGEVNTNGIYLNYNVANHDGFNWSINAPSQPSQWKQLSEVTRYNRFSNPLELKDINGNFAASKMNFDNTKTMVSGNASYTEMFSSGAEHLQMFGGIKYLDPEVTTTGVQSSEKAHTGNYSIKIITSGQAFKVSMKANEHSAGLYKISVWAHKDNALNSRIKHNGSSPLNFNGEKVHAGDWVQLNHYIELTTGAEEVYLTSIDGTIYFDDFRIHPIASSIITYVYNDYDELSYILDSNNLGTKFEYDAVGRLINTYSEIIDSPNNLGGFKISTKNFYNYKNN